MKTSLLFFSLFLTPAFAHEGGHGTPIQGLGQHGGQLVPVILARDANLGAKASTQAVAEWKRQGTKIRVYFWNRDRSKPLILSGKEVKWIFLGKAKVLVEEVKSPTSELTQTIPSLQETKAIEVILPGFLGMQEKHVFVMDLAQ